MALELSIDLCLRNNCTELLFSDTTGVYSLTGNPGGYGNPNTSTQEIDTLTLVVTDPDGNVYTLTESNLPDFPTDNDDFTYALPLNLLGNRTSIEDGYWTFRYTINTADNSYTVILGKVFTCSINCCIQKMRDKIRLKSCDSCDDYFTYAEYVKAIALRDAVVAAGPCGDVSYIEDTLEILQRLCNKNNCRTCN